MFLHSLTKLLHFFDKRLHSLAKLLLWKLFEVGGKAISVLLRTKERKEAHRNVIVLLEKCTVDSICSVTVSAIIFLIKKIIKTN